MKNPVQFIVFFAGFMGLLLGTVQGQEVNQHAKNNHFWVGLNVAKATHTIEQKMLNGQMYGVSFNYNLGIHMVTFKTNHAITKHTKRAGFGEIFLGSLLTGGNYDAPPPVHTKSSFTEVALTYGLMSSPATFRVFGSAGFSLVGGHGNRRLDTFLELGIPLEVGMMLAGSHVGVSLSYFNNANGFSNFHGVALSMHIGSLK